MGRLLFGACVIRGEVGCGAGSSGNEDGADGADADVRGGEQLGGKGVWRGFEVGENGFLFFFFCAT